MIPDVTLQWVLIGLLTGAVSYLLFTFSRIYGRIRDISVALSKLEWIRDETAADIELIRKRINQTETNNSMIHSVLTLIRKDLEQRIQETQSELLGKLFVRNSDAIEMEQQITALSAQCDKLRTDLDGLKRMN